MEQVLRVETSLQRVMACLVFLAPIFFLPWGAYPVFLNKQALVILLIFLATTLYLARALGMGRFVYPKGLRFAWLLLCAAFLSAVFAPAQTLGFLGVSGGESDTFVALLSFFLFFFLVTSALRSEYISSLTRGYFAGAALTLMYALVQLFKNILPWDFARAADFTPFGSAFGLALFLGANVLFIAGILIHNPLSRLMRGLLLALAGGCISYLLILSPVLQGMWVLLSVGIAVLFVLALYVWGAHAPSPEARMNLMRLHGKKINMLLVLLTCSILISLAPALLARFLPKVSFDLSHHRAEYQARILAENARVLEGTLGGRGFTASHAKNLIFGAGPGHYQYEYLRYRSLPANDELAGIRSLEGYSLVGTYLVSLGVIGTLLFLLFLGSLFIRYIRALNPHRIARHPSLVLLFPVLVYGLVSLFFFVPGYTSLLFFFGALGFAAREVLEEAEIAIFAKPQYIAFVSPLVILIIGGAAAGSYLVLSRAVASGYYASGTRSLNAGNLDLGLQKMGKAITWDNRMDIYYRAVSRVLGGALQGEAASDEYLERALAMGTRAQEINPREPLNYLNLAGIYETVFVLNRSKQDAGTGRAYMLARGEYESAVQHDPQNLALALMLARLHAEAGKFEEADRVLRDTFARDPDYAPAHFLAMEFALRENKLDAARDRARIIKERRSRDIRVLFELGVLYYTHNVLPDAEKELLDAVLRFPEYSNARYYLGLVYDAGKQRAQALEQFEAVQKLNPENEEVAGILKNIRAGKPAITNSR